MEQSDYNVLLKKYINVQQGLKVPKNNFNNFGKYKYRTCEDIIEAAKKLLGKEGLALLLSNEVINKGDRYYVKATAAVLYGEAKICTTAEAREDELKKGMDGSQLTGSASSYANKRALCNLFAIDDGVDADLLNVGDDTADLLDVSDDTADYSDIYQQINSINDLTSLKAYYSDDIQKRHPEYAKKNHPIYQAFLRRGEELQNNK